MCLHGTQLAVCVPVRSRAPKKVLLILRLPLPISIKEIKKVPDRQDHRPNWSKQCLLTLSSWMTLGCVRLMIKTKTPSLKHRWEWETLLYMWKQWDKNKVTMNMCLIKECINKTLTKQEIHKRTEKRIWNNTPKDKSHLNIMIKITTFTNNQNTISKHQHSTT